MTAHLLPCPFCDGEAQFGESPDGGEFIECSNRRCKTSSKLMYPNKEGVKDLLAEAWNQRVPKALSGASIPKRLVRDVFPTVKVARPTKFPIDFNVTFDEQTYNLLMDISELHKRKGGSTMPSKIIAEAIEALWHEKETGSNA